jgi:iron complex outermembrane receptor protein
MLPPSLIRVRPDRTRRRAGHIVAAGALLGLLVPAPSRASDSQLASLADLTLEQLTLIEVTSVSRRSERLADAAAAIYVISGEEIRRSGATTLPEVLRLAPNLEVARADANQYAISARGFASVLANKLLVMIDGRTVYSPLFSGVFWEAQDLVLRDIERIEIVSGPGGTLWGTNAVNGVINVVTRPAQETMDPLVALGGGSEILFGAARVGRALGRGGAYRVYVKGRSLASSERGNGNDVDDDSERFQGGFRSDWGSGANRFTFQGDAYRGDIDQGATVRRIEGLNLLGRWIRQRGAGPAMEIQAYFDRTTRDQPGAIREELNAVELQFQHGFRTFASQNVLWGAGYRYQPDRVVNLNPAAFAFRPPNRKLGFASVFVQDDVALGERVTATAGLKLEHNQYTHLEYLPNLRLAWKPGDERLLWGAVSRAVRAPARIDREFYTPGNPPFFLAGGPEFQSELSYVAELGYRAQPSTSTSYSVTAFYDEWDGLRSLEPSPEGLVFANGVEGISRGVEAWASCRIVRAWKLSAGWVAQSIELHTAPGEVNLGGLAPLGNDPRQWWSVRSSLDVGDRVDLDVAVRQVGRRPDPEVPRYTALDARLGWWPVDDMELYLAGRNLFDPMHPEWGAPGSRAESQREVFAGFTWRK